ncbi:T9SS type A sorting domain-containing protein [Psychroflexus sp. MES1-P1E]|uniref:T9SS type A sorting domain-containing protein n=1 Tax=Psychroflexus sp. MES1-P1E TaxID=2058320 RepID=UPI000C7D1E00|nr:T9SS type A sorting domain-containing protein [Psychroflexus sp. MES1-P1E]PKG41405.1 hypothetical protein CXF67_16485 [Psychroflexus sp. MES1-P1E]
MKKITFLVATFLISIGMYAQETLSHSASQESIGGSVACASNPDDEPNTGDEGVSDNIYYRAYFPEDFGFSGSFTAMGVGFVAEFTDVGGSDPTVTNTVRLYTSDDKFPDGTLTEIASQDFEVSAADDGATFEIMFETPVDLDASTELIVAVDISASPAVPDNYDFRIGHNVEGEDEPSYISAEPCGLIAPVTLEGIGFGDQNIILNLIGDVTLGSDDFSLSQISVFPNPVNYFLKVNIPSNLELLSADLYDVLGRNTGVAIANGEINVSNLASGIYILKIETSAGSLSKKVVIE